MTVPAFEKPEQGDLPETPHFSHGRKAERPERTPTLGREVHERYPAAVVGGLDSNEAPAAAFPDVTADEGASLDDKLASSASATPAANATPPATGGGGEHDASPAPRDAYRDELTHVDARGDVRMVDVGAKAVTQRLAVAEGSILMHPETQAMVLEDRAKKGDVLACARVAGIMASKRTSDLVPMCHPLNLTKVKVEIDPIPAAEPPVTTGADAGTVGPDAWAPARDDGRVGFRVRATCGVTGVTGIEMEALTAASVACLTIYDMCKAVDRAMEIVDVRLLRKEGGRSGLWERAGFEGMGGSGIGAESPEGATAGAPAGPATAGPEPSPEPEDLGPSPLPGGPRTGAAAPAIAFVGYQNAGKTTLVEKVISRLTQRGLRVGSIKHHGHKGFDIDQPGKDSWRHAQAGSRHVGLVSPGAYAEYARIEGEVPVRDLIAHYTDVDVVIVEGYKTAGLPSIAVARSGIDRMRGRDSFDLIDENTLAVACNDVVARGFRTRAAKLAKQAAEEAGVPFREEDVSLPPFLDINDSASIASFVFDQLQKMK